eukprot:10119856-Karenia_brevis.AAC.1
MESSSDSERSIGVKSHDDPSVIARRKRMGMRDNKFNDEEDDEEDGGGESSSSTPLQPESRPVGAPRNYKEEIKEEQRPMDDRDFS